MLGLIKSNFIHVYKYTNIVIYRTSLPGCGQLSYSGRLAKLNLDSLELRRLKADLT